MTRLLLISVLLSIGGWVHAQHAPILSGIPEDIQLSCSDPVPAAVAPVITTDLGCAVVSTEVIEKYLCNSYMEYDLSLPDFPDPNSVFGLWLPGLPNGLGDEYHWDQSRSKLFASDQNAYLLAEAYDPNDSSVRFEVLHEFENGLGWAGWSALYTVSPPIVNRSYKDDAGHAVAGGDLYEDWQYYEMDGNSSYVTGLESREGDAISVSHAPTNYLFGFQIGQAGNSVDDGLGCWIWGVYDGTMSGSDVSGVHSLVASLEELGAVSQNYCADAILRTYRVEDSCGNVSKRTQLITFTGGAYVGDINGDGALDVCDFLSLNSSYGSSCASCPEDLDGNGVVDINDFLILNNQLSCM